MIRLDQVVLREIHLPLREPFRISSGAVSMRRIILLELTDASGVASWSECVAGEWPNYSSETVDTAWLALEAYVAPRVLGVRFDKPADVHATLDRDFRGHRMAKAAVEMGLWGVAAAQAGVPLARLIGGERERVPVGISLGIQPSPQALADKAMAAMAEGYHKVKIKIEPGHDLKYLRAAREALPSAELMADANNAYSLADASLFREMDELNLMMIEQPLAHDDLVRHAELQRQLRTALCLDESITSLDRAQDMVTLGAGRIINIKPGRVGGFAASIGIHNYCQRQGIPVWCGGMLESGVGRAYNVALASLPNFILPGDLSPSRRYWSQDIVSPEWTMDEEGMMAVPLGRTGIGVDVDTERVDALTVRRAVLRA
jgi:O-succinylbenzoate synthase